MARGKSAHTRIHGVSLIWVTVFMTGFCVMGSLAVDFGRYQVVKNELRRAADAAARAAASSISNPAAARKLAYDYAFENKADGQPVVLEKSANETGDIIFGKWDSDKREFTPLTGALEATANSVKVYARRLASRGTAIPLVFTKMLPGAMGSCDAQVYTIATVAPESYGVIGLNSISMTGNTSSSYWSDGSGTTAGAGNIASNGPITLSGGATVQGNAKGSTVSGGTVTGTRSQLSAPLSFPPGDAGGYATVNDNAMISTAYLSGGNFTLGKNKNLTLPGGKYYFNNFSTATGSSLTFNAPTTIYCYGTFSMTGQTNTSADLPKNLQIVMVPSPTGNPPGNVSITAGASLYANVYAPQSNVSITGGGAIYGSVLGLNVNMSGGGSIRFDLALSAGSKIVIVE
jgi:Flp pilus assembly protein TadG